MKEQFISEPVEPDTSTVETAPLLVDEPGMPGRFRWRGQACAVAAVLERWRETGPCRNGSGERYRRKHWFRIRTEDGLEMKLYFDRAAAAGLKKRWWLYTVTRPPETPAE